MTEELLPCPFCGGEARTDKFLPLTPPSGTKHCYMVTCNNNECSITVHTEERYSKKNAITNWNTRRGK